MLIFLLLFAVLRTLQGAPVAPSHFPDANDLLDFVARDGPATSCDCGQNLRTRFSIVQSCLLTIFACVWKAMHPNINGETDSGWTRFKRKITTTLVALIAPEVILFWALKQRSSAKAIAGNYNKEISKVEVEKAKLSFARKTIAFLRGCVLAPSSSIRSFFQLQPRDDGQRWTKTHGFFIQMGGFMLYENGNPTEVLDYARLVSLIQDKSIDQPTVTERELQDRSKGDAVSKGVIVWQTTWFALQCCARLAQRLPLSELELVTLAFTVVNVAIYAAWWDKPQSVETAIRVQLKGVEAGSGGAPLATTSASDADLDSENNVDHPSAELACVPTDTTNCAEELKPNDTSTSEAHPSVTEDGQSIVSDKRPLLSKDKPTDKESWWRRELREVREMTPLPSFLLIVAPTYLVASLLRPASKISKPDVQFDRKRLRVPMFYRARNRSNTAGYSLTVIGLIFGAIHFVAWTSEFPSRQDQVLWRCAAIALLGFPSFYILLGIVSVDGKVRQFESKAVTGALNVLRYFIGYGLFLPSAILYIPARLVVIILALKAIGNPSPAILQDVSWTSFLPHL